MWRAIKIFLVLYLIVNLIGAYFYWHRIDQFLRFMPRVAEANFAPPTDKLEAQRQDFSYLRTVLDYDRSFSSQARTAFTAKLETLTAADQTLSEAEFYLTVRELMALADNGHTGTAQGPAFRDFNRSGVDAYPFKDGLFVSRAHGNHEPLLGHQIIEIEGRPIADVMTALERFSGGPKQWRDQQSLFFLRSPELLYTAGLAQSPDQLEMTFESAAGEITTQTLTALPAAGESASYFRHSFLTLSPSALADEGEAWVQTLGGRSDDIAPYVQDMFEAFKTENTEGGLYIRSNYLMSSLESPVKAQLLSALETAPEDGYDFIALDLRWNPGGDYGNALPFAKQARGALSPDGKIYVITGPNTFSAAIVFAALVKQYAPDQTLLIGEPMGDRPQFWAERGKPFILPNSNLWINYAVGYHDWETGCAKTHEFCFTPNERQEADIGSLAVDRIIAPTYDDYKSGRDIVMDHIIADRKTI